MHSLEFLEILVSKNSSAFHLKENILKRSTCPKANSKRQSPVFTQLCSMPKLNEKQSLSPSHQSGRGRVSKAHSPHIC